MNTRDFYKRRCVAFDATSQERRVINASRRSMDRRAKRSSVHMGKRNIQIDDDSNYPKALPTLVEEEPRPKIPAKKSQAQERFLKLQKYKEEKALRLNTKKQTSKPAFKCGAVKHSYDVFTTVQSEPAKNTEQRFTRSMGKKSAPINAPKTIIKVPKANAKITDALKKKQKPVAKVTQKTAEVQSSFAPTDFVFKPLVLKSGRSSKFALTTTENTTNVMNSNMEPEEKNKKQRNQPKLEKIPETSRSSATTSNDVQKGLNVIKTASPLERSVLLKLNEEADISCELPPTPDLSIDSPKKTRNENIVVTTTPAVSARRSNETLGSARRTYISPLLVGNPWITTERGSSSKKNKMRDKIGYNNVPVESIDGLLSASNTENVLLEEANVATGSSSETRNLKYFKELHETTKTELLEESASWEKLIDEDSEVPEQILGDIRSVTGSVRLLIGQKMKQFEDLVQQSASDPKITLDDLEGFWGLVSVGLNGVRKQFAHLQKLKENDWRNESPVKKARKVAVKGKAKKATSSRIKSLIAASRKKMKETADNDDVENGVSVLEDIQTIEQCAPPRRSLRSKCIVLTELNVSNSVAHSNTDLVNEFQSLKKDELATGRKALRKCSVHVGKVLSQENLNITSDLHLDSPSRYHMRPRKSISNPVIKTLSKRNAAMGKDSRPSLLPFVLLTPTKISSPTVDLIDFSTPSLQANRL